MGAARALAERESVIPAHLHKPVLPFQPVQFRVLDHAPAAPPQPHHGASLQEVLDRVAAEELVGVRPDPEGGTE